jgi:GNAT superfamily N-acetyltransferase
VSLPPDEKDRVILSEGLVAKGDQIDVEGRMTVHRAMADDAAALAPLFDAYRRFFTGGNDLKRSAHFLSERLERDECVVFFARMNSDPIGFIQLYPLWSSWYCARIWFLSDLYVAEHARKHGAGRLLVERVKEYAHETSASSVMVELPLGEPHLRAFYANLGFHEDSVFALARYTG